MNQACSGDASRQTALEILGRTPVDRSRRASFGSDQRTEHVLLLWRDGQSRRLEQSQDDRISFALRDRFESSQPNCREQMRRLVSVLGEPGSVTVAWSYQAVWEGESPLNQTGRCQFSWSEVAEMLHLSDNADGG